MPEVTQEVYKAIVAVSAEIAKTGIAKTRTNVQQSYKFRGIDDVFNEIAPLLAKHHLCILPRVLNRYLMERVSAKGGALNYVTVEMEFDFVCATDGSKHTIKTFGEAMDSGDKATNKAMSAAYKYAALQTFCIPTEGDNDTDAGTGTTEQADLDPAVIATFEAAKTADELKTAWNVIPAGSRRIYTQAKNVAKERVAAAKATA